MNHQYKQCEICGDQISVGAICDKCLDRMHPPKSKQFRYWYSEKQKQMRTLLTLHGNRDNWTPTSLVQLPDRSWKHYTQMSSCGANANPNFPDSVLVTESDTNLPIRTA